MSTKSEIINKAGRSLSDVENGFGLIRSKDRQRSFSYDVLVDEFHNASREKVLRTGRQRKKLAARNIGGEFETRLSKKRVYFCCVGSEIDIPKMFSYLVSAGGLLFGWQYHMYNDVLHLFKAGVENHSVDLLSFQSQKEQVEADSVTVDKQTLVTTENLANPFKISSRGAQEVFVFDFGAAVFWGFTHGQEAHFLKTIQMFVTKGVVEGPEFLYGVDDLAFVTSQDISDISVVNDVISLPDDSVAKQRLSVSFALAQSSVLAVFEARIEQKVSEYKHIPETLSRVGEVKLSQQELSMMVGDVFVIRHDVNLHTEILDTPDFFWKEEKFFQDYKMIMAYLEMSSRTDILNKRLDMLRELLDVLQQQRENAHGVKLEMIVIWLIMAEVLLEVFAIIREWI